MSYTDIRHHTARFEELPEKLAADFTAHRGTKPPIKGQVYVELVHRTDEGLAIGPRVRADLIHDERWATPEDELGSIAFWRLAPEIEPEKVALPTEEQLRQAMEAKRAAAEEPSAEAAT